MRDKVAIDNPLQMKTEIIGLEFETTSTSIKRIAIGYN